MSMTNNVIIHYDSAADRAEAVRGIMNMKQEWLAYVQQRKAKFGIK